MIIEDQTTNQILNKLKNDRFTTYHELKAAILVLIEVNEFYRREIGALQRAIRSNDKAYDRAFSSDFLIDDIRKIMNSNPVEYLGESGIPGNTKYDEKHKIIKRRRYFLKKAREFKVIDKKSA